MNIADNTFLVSGGSSGLGAATARALAERGGYVLVADLDAGRGEALVGSLGKRARFAKTDVTREADVHAAVALSVQHFGALHGAINCAGIAPGERVLRKDGPHSLENFRRAIEINLIGTFNVLRLAAQAMSAQPATASGARGIIINTSSVAADDGQIGQSAYAASKAGVDGLTLPAARELAMFGIRVVTVAPGIFDTPLMRGMRDDVRASLAQQIPFPPRFGQPQEYAALVLHAIENEYLNGTVLRLDGAVRMGAR